MKRRFSLFLVLAALAAAGTAWAEDQVDSPWSFYASTGVYSDYVFRGMTLYDATSVQPNIGVSYDFGDYGRLNTNLWMHIPASSKDVKTIDQFSESLTGFSSLNSDEIFSPSKKFVELDPTISYDITVDLVTFSVGHTWYTDPDTGEVEVIRGRINEETGEPEAYSFTANYSRGDTAEVFASAALDWYLQPEVTIVKDYRNFDYEYYTLGFSQPVALTEDQNLAMTPFVLFAWATGVPDDDRGNFSTNYTKNGLVHVNVGLALQAVIGNWSIKPNVTYIFTEDPNEGEDDIIYSGFEISYSM